MSEEAKNSMTFKDKAQKTIYKIIDPFIDLLIKLKVTPNMITSFGFLLNVGAAGIFILGAEHGERGDLRYVGWAGGVILFAGLFDMIDGHLARKGNLESTFGALYDSVIDRYSEGVMFLGICYYLVAHGYFFSSLFSFIALIGSMMVSYTRARAEGLGVECKGGWMQRPERVVLISLSALLCGIISTKVTGFFICELPCTDIKVESIAIFTVPVTVVAVLANLTAHKRLMSCKKALS